jgi:LAO/AO transport system kinase
LRKRAYDPEGFPKALPVSAVEQMGLEKAWAEMQALEGWRRENGFFATRRAEQARHWFEAEVREGLLARLEADPEIRSRMRALGASVAGGQVAASAAAAEMLAALAQP